MKINKKIKSVLLGIVEYAVAAVAIFFIVRLIINQWNIIQDNLSSFRIEAIIVSLILGVFGLFIQGLAWHYFFKTIGKKVRLIDTLNAYHTSNLIRYIPGNIWSYLARIRLHGKLGITGAEVLYLSLVEIIFWIVSGWAIFLISLLFWSSPLVFSNKYTVFLIVSILFAAFSILAPAIIKWYIGKYWKKQKINFAFIRLPFFKLAKIFILYLLFWICYGFSLYFAAASIINDPWYFIIPAIGINAVAWIIGFVSFITPSGIGAREPAMIFFMASYFETAVSSVISILARLVTIVSDILIVVIVKILRIYVFKKN